jgi:hypothetical protein
VNSFLPETFVEHVDRLALGLEPRDAVSRLRPARRVDVALDGPPQLGPHVRVWPEPDAAAGLRALARHGSGRHVLLFDGPIDTPIAIRLVPRDRRYVPRRIRFTMPDLQAVLDAEADGADVPATGRAWRPVLFPGVAYDIPATRSGVRGRVTRAGAAVRWTRVEAIVDGHVIGHAHGDDRGEFLLVLGQNAGAVGDLTRILEVTIDVYAHDPDLPVSATDPLGDLPLEDAAAAGAAVDHVSSGITLPGGHITLPAGYALAADLPLQPLTLGRLTSVPIAV